MSGAIPNTDGFPEIVGILMVILMLVNVLSVFLSIAVYVLQSLGMYTIAERRQIKHPWLAWIPMGNVWILGSISDQYQYVVKGQIKNRRKALLGLSIASMLIVMVVWVLYVAFLVNAIVNSEALEFMPESQAEQMILVVALVFGGISLLAGVLAIISAVIQYVALYDLYASCSPDNKVAFIVLSILFSITMPFFVFACRKKDLGMPPRRTIVIDPPVFQPEQ